MPRTLTRSTALAPLVALTLLLGACDTGKDEPAEGASEGGGEQAALEGAECLHGSWVLDEHVLREKTEDLVAESGLDATIDVSGDFWISFDGGNISYTYQNQVIDVAMEEGGQEEMRSVTTMNGFIWGTYRATATDVTMTITDASQFEATVDAYMDGTLVPGGSTVLDDTMRSEMETTSTAPYTCSGDTLTISLSNGGLGTPTETVLKRGW